MDARTFAERIRVALETRLGRFEVRITEDDLPAGVDFLVISDDFEGTSRGSRIQFIADVVEAAFGLPLGFRPMGRAATTSEFQQEVEDGNSESGHTVASSAGGNAARALD
jgi:hypothetical protein